MKDLTGAKITGFVVEKIIGIIFFNFLLSFQIFAYPGQLDWSFRSVLMDEASVTQVEVQPDGKVLIGGSFTTLGAIVRRNLARLNTDGSIDATFNAGDVQIQVMRLQNDGKLLIGGVNLLKRLNTDGSVDTTFNVTGITIPITEDIDVQTDGKILINKGCGMDLTCSRFLTRLNSDGSVDLINGSPFNFSSGGTIYSVTYVPSENKILVGGNLTYTINGTQYKGLVRINLNGTIDPTFTAQINKNMSNFVSTYSEPLSNGKILVWGDFDTVDQSTRHGIAVLNSNGSVDASFVPAINNSPNYFLNQVTISTVAVQSDGKIIVGGWGSINTSQGFRVYPYLDRLNSDGNFDRTFNRGKNKSGSFATVKIQNGNRLIIGGQFVKFDGFLRRSLAKLKLF